jgi:protein phosphatase
MTVGLRDEATLPSDIVHSLRELFATTATTRSGVDEWAASSHIGTSRRENQDAWGQRDGTFVVADGMGGRPGGSTAATAAIAAALDTFGATATLHPLDWSARMARVNDAVMAAGRRAGHDRVGAAIAVVRCIPGRVVISHAGDVRIYRLRDDEAQLLTRDHNVGAEINAAGRDPDTLTSALGKTAALTSFLGAPTSWQRHSLRVLDTRPGDWLVVCTDGVHRRVGRQDWFDGEARLGCQALVDHLVERSGAAGSTDDRTALAIRLGSTA